MEGKEVSGYVWKYSNWLVTGPVVSWLCAHWALQLSKTAPRLWHSSWDLWRSPSLGTSLIRVLRTRDKQSLPAATASSALVPGTPLHSDSIVASPHPPRGSSWPGLKWLLPEQINKLCVGIQGHTTKIQKRMNYWYRQKHRWTSRMLWPVEKVNLKKLHTARCHYRTSLKW